MSADDNVVDFAQKKLEASPHTQGPAICLGCRHEWHVVVPVGVDSFECPKCHLMKGVHKYLVMPEDGAVWVCNCGNKYFVITGKLNAMCPNCGEHQRIDPLC